jgi:hypothetical protein
MDQKDSVWEYEGREQESQRSAKVNKTYRCIAHEVKAESIE